jgi:hypothetical protein
MTKSQWKLPVYGESTRPSETRYLGTEGPCATEHIAEVSNDTPGGDLADDHALTVLSHLRWHNPDLANELVEKPIRGTGAGPVFH